MTPKPSPTEVDKARSQLMMGAMIVMAACVFGGLTAVVLMALGYRMAAGAVAIVAGLAILAGIAIQVAAMKKLKARRERSK